MGKGQESRNLIQPNCCLKSKETLKQLSLKSQSSSFSKSCLETVVVLRKSEKIPNNYFQEHTEAAVSADRVSGYNYLQRVINLPLLLLPKPCGSSIKL